jgi:3'-phosphoadenosine 5'-phosphosulfate sulfotransferase (PAPS reductase)/FAD synthetase
MQMKYLGWFSCGVTSAVACKLALEKFGEDVDLWYIETGAGHVDNARFIRECEEWYGRKIQIARSEQYSSPLDVAKHKIFNTPYGAPCTYELKKKVRQKIQNSYAQFTHVFGFEYTPKEIHRATRWMEQNTKDVIFPLIEHKLNKQDCLLILQKQGIEIPQMYKLGYNNNNCIGCFKGGAGYWNKIRKDFPEVFQKTAELERIRKSTCLKANGKALYLDELDPKAGNHKDLQLPDCGLFCELEQV